MEKTSVAAALLTQAVVVKDVLDKELAALWVFIVFLISGERGRAAQAGTATAVVAVTAAVLGLYAL